MRVCSCHAPHPQATATREMISSLTSLLDIPPEGVITTPLLRPNLKLSASEAVGWGSNEQGVLGGIDQIKY